MTTKQQMIRLAQKGMFTAMEVEEIFVAMMKQVHRGRPTSNVCGKRGHPMVKGNIRQQVRVVNGERRIYRGGCRLCHAIDTKLRECGVE